MDIFVLDAVKKNNPDFSRLLDNVIEKYESSTDTKTKSNKSCQQESNQHLKKSHSRFYFLPDASRYWLSKSEWLESHVIFYTTRLILHEIEFKILNNELPEHETKCWNSVIRRFYLSQCPASLFKTEFQPVKTSKDDQNALTEGKKLLASALETRLEKLALNLIDARDGLDADENNTIRLARALQTGSILQSDNASLKNNRKKTKELEIKFANLQNNYHQVLKEFSHILMKIITKYHMRLLPHKGKAVVKNAITSCTTLAAKLKSIRCELNCETYSPRSLQALKALRLEIEETTKRREVELKDVEQQLEIYRRLGSDFEAIATEYSNVRKNLDRQKWTFDEINKKLTHSV